MSWRAVALECSVSHMTNARLEVNDGLGQRIVPINKALLCIGRRTENDLRLVGSDVSREHAEIVAGRRRLDPARQGLALRHLRQRRGDHRAQADARRSRSVRPRQRRRRRVPDRRRRRRTPIDRTPARSTISASWRRCSRACARSGSGRVLDEVLALVLDAAIDVAGAERGFIMLASDGERARDEAGARQGPHHAARQPASTPAARFPKRSSRPAS